METEKKSSGGMGKILLGILITLGAIVLCCAASSFAGLLGTAGIVSEASKNIEEQKQVETNKNDEAWNNPAKLNEAIAVKDVSWTVVSAQDLGSTIKSKYSSFGEDCKANSGKFIKVTLKVKNNYKEIKTLTDVDLLDDQKREFKTSTDTFGCIDGDLYILANINPGIEKTFIAVYEVPNDAKGLKLKLGDLDFFSKEFKYVTLGL
jgi:hypothetical protein